MAKQTAISMDELLEKSSIKQLAPGEVIDGVVTLVQKHQVWLDLGPYGMGLVIRREIGQGRKLQEGDEANVSVIDPELDDGTVLVSMRKAAKDRGWDVLKEAMDNKQSVTVEPYDANRGGLLIEYEGIRGFLPVSQLTSEHYPRVSGADKDEILQRLNFLTRQPLKVRILDVDRKQNKLIFSEKEAVREDIEERFAKLKVGDTVDGVITGVVDFGAFVNVEGIEGLIHISEISWERVEDPSKFVKPGQKVEAKIIAIDNDRLSLSLKQLQSDPWLSEVSKFKVGDQAEGTVTRITPFGAFIQISPAVEALVHISELGESEDTSPEKIFRLDEKKKFTILEIDESARKVSLSLKPSNDKAKKSKTSTTTKAKKA
jgi:small subunit ribosomal protein S1